MLVNGVEFFYILADNLTVLLVSEWGFEIPSVTVGVSVSSFSCISFCFLCFEILLFGACTFGIVCLPGGLILLSSM